jgi:hypothetical protein
MTSEEWDLISGLKFDNLYQENGIEKEKERVCYCFIIIIVIVAVMNVKKYM